jgi:hypothetical protein
MSHRTYITQSLLAGEVRKDLLPYLFALAGLLITKHKVVSYGSRDPHRLIAQHCW